MGCRLVPEHVETRPLLNPDKPGIEQVGPRGVCWWAGESQPAAEICCIPPKTGENLPTHSLLVTTNGQELCTEKQFLLAEEGVGLNDWLLRMQEDSWPPWRKTWKQWI